MSRKSSTTNLPAALREELGLSAPAPRGAAPSRGGVRGGRGGGGASRGRGLSVIGRGRSAEMGSKRGEVRSHTRKVEPSKVTASASASKPPPKPATATVTPREVPKPTSQLSKTPAVGEKRKRSASSERSSAQSTVQQRKHVSSSAQTPLERMLQRVGKSSSSSSKKPTSSSAAREAAEEAAEKRRRAAMTKQERDEEDEIRWLEAKLGAEREAEKKAKGKGKAKKSEREEDEESIGGGEDGLDDFLDDLDRFYPGMYESGEEDESDASMLEGDDDDDDQGSGKEEDEEMRDGSEDDEDDDLGDWDAAMQSGDSGSGEEEEESDEEDGSADEEEAPAPAAVPEPASTGRYIPPAARAAAAAAAAASAPKGSAASSSAPTLEQQKLRRQAKGLLNRLGDGNIESILSELEALYRTHSRAEVTTCLTDLILGTISASADLVDTFIILYAALIAALHRVMGVEFAAQLLQSAIDALLKHHTAARQAGVAGEESSKEAVNLVALLAGMYNLGVLASPLMYDLMRLFLGVGEADTQQRMVEADVEVLLRLVKTCGAQLRHDDPAALKSVIQAAQQSVGSTDTAAQQGSVAGGSSSRTKFMLEALSDLKNNRAKAAAAAESSPSGQALVRMRKFLAGLAKKRTLRAHDALRVGLKDLRESATRGKWWLVGAAWAGHGDADEAEGVTAARPLRKAPAEEAAQRELLEVARKQGMNTEARRNVFVALMSGEDYVDASQRLLSLRLNDTQRREIVRVLLHCIGGEAIYNPYYSLIGVQLSADSASTRITMQYCLWDYLRTLGEKNVGGRTIIEREGAENDWSDEEEGDEASDLRAAKIARAYGWWFAKGSLGINALKPINFPTLKRRGERFLQLVLIHTLLSTQVSSPAATLKPRDAAHARGDHAAIESVIVKGTAGNADLAQGLLIFLERSLGAKQVLKLVGGKKADVGIVARLNWAVKVAKEVLTVGASVKPY